MPPPHAVLADRRGNAGILFALSMPVLLGFAAMGTEVGLWYLARRTLQTAADVAAISAAHEMIAGSGDEQEAATQEATRHNVPPGPDRDLEVNLPPARGAAAGDADAVEVVLTERRPLLFAALFATGPVSIQARAVARVDGDGTACVLALHPTAYRAVDVAGTANLSMPSCMLAANSSDTEAIAIRGNADVAALALATAGDYAVSGSGALTTGRPARTGIPPLADPYADREAPAAGPCAHTGYARTAATPATLSPGTFCGGISLGGKAVVDLQPGTYVVSGGSLTVNAGATVTCTGCTGGAGVTIVLTGTGTDIATVRINGDADISLRAPSSGANAGLLFRQDPRAPAGGENVFNGGARMRLEGALYFPSQNLAFRGNNGLSGAGCTQLVARQVSITGDSVVGSDCDGLGVEDIDVGGTVALVE